MRISAFIAFSFPSRWELMFEIAGPEEAKNLAVQVLRLIQIRFSAAEYAKVRSRLSKQFAHGLNRVRSGLR